MIGWISPWPMAIIYNYMIIIIINTNNNNDKIIIHVATYEW